MDIEAFCRQSRVVITVGKGGVGKTTVSAVLATMAARVGLEVLVVVLDDAGALHRCFDSDLPIAREPVELWNSGVGGRWGRVRSQLVTADAALSEYLASRGLDTMTSRVAHGGVIDLIATTTPGIREMLILGKIKQLAQSGVADLVIVDAPATGHALSLLSSPVGLADATRSGPLRSQADQLVTFLADESQCQILLVTIPEETPVSEAIETGFRLEDTMNVALAPMIVNGCYPNISAIDEVDQTNDPTVTTLAASDIARLRAAATFRSARTTLQAVQCTRLARELPLAQLILPYLFVGEIDARHCALLSDALEVAIERC